MGASIDRHERRLLARRAFAHPGFEEGRRAGAASLVLAGAPLRVVWANAAAAARFEAATVDAVGRRVLGSDRGSSRRLEERAGTLAAGGAPVLERLRFSWALAARSMTVLCVRPVGFAEPALALMEMHAPDQPFAWDDDLENPDEATPGRPPDSAGEAARSPEPRRNASRSEDRPVSAAGRGEPTRLRWRTNADGEVEAFDTAPLKGSGVTWDPRGQSMAACVGAMDAAAGDRLAEMVEGRRTFHDIVVTLPAEAGREAVLALSGAPAFSSGGFAGFRGFGLVQARAARVSPGVGGHQDRSPQDAAPSVSTDVRAGQIEGPRDPAIADAEPAPVDPPARATSDAQAISDTQAISDAQETSAATNVVHLRPPGATARHESGASDWPRDEARSRSADPVSPRSLSEVERSAFQEIGRALVSLDAASLPDRAQGEDTVSSPMAGSADETSARGEGVLRSAVLAVERAAVGLLVLRGSRVVFANDAVLRRLGFGDHASLADAVGLQLLRENRRADAKDGELPLVDAAGARVDVRAIPTPVDWTDGEAATLWTLLPPRRAEAAESELHGVLRRLFEAAPEAGALVDDEGRVLLLNRRALADAEGSAETLSALLAEPDAAALAEDMSRLGAEGRVLAGAARRRDGNTVPVRITLTRVAPGSVLANWTEAAPILASPQAAGREAPFGQPELLTKISDELRTPLNAILGFTEIMMDERFGPLGNSRYKDYLHDIHASGQQVMKVVDDLVDLSSIEAGRAGTELEPVDVNKVAADCVSESQAEAHRKRVIVRTSLGLRLPPIGADRHSVRQIVANLLSNAIRFNEPGGQVIVSTAVNDGGTVMLRVRDTGIGMSDDEVAAALEPLRRAGSSRSPGLGLSIAKALIVASGASLSIRSRVREGTMVEVMFQPLSTGGASRASA